MPGESDYPLMTLGDIDEIDLVSSQMTSTPSSSSSSSSTGPGLGDFMKFGSSILGGFGAYMQGQQMAEADYYNASLARTAGEFQIEELSSEEGEMLATQKAMYSKAGVEMAGSPLETALHTATAFEFDKQVAKYNSESKARMYEYQAAVAKNKGEFNFGMGLLQGGIGLLTA